MLKFNQFSCNSLLDYSLRHRLKLHEFTGSNATNIESEGDNALGAIRKIRNGCVCIFAIFLTQRYEKRGTLVGLNTNALHYPYEKLNPVKITFLILLSNY